MRKGYLCFRMGSCITIEEKSDYDVKPSFQIASKANKRLIPLPTKFEKFVKGDRCNSELGFKAMSSPQLSSLKSSKDFGSKEEIFFESQAWLDSDCEDFYSVKGDFTPSCGNTPKHPSFSVAPQSNKSTPTDGSVGTKTESPPSGRKKILAELFLESFRRDQDADNQICAVYQTISKEKLESNKPFNPNLTPSPRSSYESPYMNGVNSICSKDTASNQDFKPEKGKLTKAAQWCLPSFVCGSPSDRKKNLAPVPIEGRLAQT